jgi:hypothetical protein
MSVVYRIIRHSLSPGFILGFWATPVMTVAHLVFAVATMVYILMAVQLEERDLMEAHSEYAEYCRTLPMIILFVGGRKGRAAEAAGAARASVAGLQCRAGCEVQGLAGPPGIPARCFYTG